MELQAGLVINGMAAMGFVADFIACSLLLCNLTPSKAPCAMSQNPTFKNKKIQTLMMCVSHSLSLS